MRRRLTTQTINTTTISTNARPAPPPATPIIASSGNGDIFVSIAALSEVVDFVSSVIVVDSNDIVCVDETVERVEEDTRVVVVGTVVDVVVKSFCVLVIGVVVVGDLVEVEGSVVKNVPTVKAVAVPVINLPTVVVVIVVVVIVELVGSSTGDLGGDG